MRRFLILILLVGLALGSLFVFREAARKEAPPPSARTETIPPGIVVTESSSTVSAASLSAGGAPGDLSLIGYADSGLSPKSDLEMLSDTLTNFLTVSKQAHTFPLSANEEWSAALTGKRLGSEAWISSNHRILDSENRLIDRWNSPLHFHALGDRMWEIRSAGPDRIMWNEDDLMESLPRSSSAQKRGE